jgi:hypothetical protein
VTGELGELAVEGTDRRERTSSASISRANSAPRTSDGTTMFQHSTVLQSWSLSGRTVQARKKRSMAGIARAQVGPAGVAGVLEQARLAVCRDQHSWDCDQP